MHVLSTRFNEPSEEVLAKWHKADGIKKRKKVFIDGHWTGKMEECDTDDEDGEYLKCTIQSYAASTTKLFLEEGKAAAYLTPSSPWSPARAWSSTRIRPTRT